MRTQFLIMGIILVVDDEALVLKFVRLALERAAHTVITAFSGAEAFAMVSKLARVDVLIVDHSLSPDAGRDVAERLLLTYPEMKVMHISGWPQEHVEQEGSLVPGAAFLAKPFTLSQVQDAVALLAPNRSAAGRAAP
jgi:two-component system, cell cycle sensor histidine kinase and response regulator CckA